MTDIEIAQAHTPKKITEIAAAAGIDEKYLELYGNYKAKIDPKMLNETNAPDGRVFGKMGHSERIGYGLYKNVPGEYDIRMFESAVKYFKN